MTADRKREDAMPYSESLSMTSDNSKNVKRKTMNNALCLRGFLKEGGGKATNLAIR